jgi:small conductance mechanosensitive channel
LTAIGRTGISTFPVARGVDSLSVPTAPFSPLRVQLPQAPADTTSALADSLNVSLDRLGENVTNTGRLILSGQWGEVFERLLTAATNLAVSFVPNLLSALFVGITFYAIYRALAGLTAGFLHRSERVDLGFEAIANKTLRVVGWTFILLLVLSQLGIDLSALIAGLGIAGLALGFAAKDSLENFISGITILLDRPFRVGDWVTVGEHYGRVTNITLRSTRLRTLNQETVIFPSRDLVTQPVVNHSDGTPLRVDVPFGIAYKEDIDEARETVMALLDPLDERLVEGGGHRVVTTKLNDSSVDLELHVFVKDPGNAVPVRFHFVERVRKALAAADIEIPFPHLQLFIDGAEGLRDTPIRVASD